jgi:hypothetical protein
MWQHNRQVAAIIPPIQVMGHQCSDAKMQSCGRGQKFLVTAMHSGGLQLLA